MKLLYILIGLILGTASVAYAAPPILSTFQGGTGTTSPSGILYGNGATGHLNTVTIGSGCTFSAGTLSCPGSGGISVQDPFPGHATTSALTLASTTFTGPVSITFPYGIYQEGKRIFFASSTAGTVVAGFRAGTALGTSTNYFGDVAGNTVMGFRALEISTSSVEQTAFGYGALANFVGSDNTPTAAGNNTAIGFKTLYRTTTGYSNTAVGDDALSLTTTGDHNTGIGTYALYTNTTGIANTAVGANSLQLNSTGDDNTVVGEEAMFNSTTGSQNVAIGKYTMLLSATGDANTAVGYQSMRNNLTGSNNVALGKYSLYNTGAPTTTTAIGFQSGFGGAAYNTQGGTYLGYSTAFSVLTGADWNTLIGNRSGQGITTGSKNTFVGASNISGSHTQVTTGSQNISIGYNTQVPDATANGQLDIGNFIYGTGLTGTGTTLSSGKIGFGTTTPATQVSVQGDALVSGTLTAGALNATSTFTGAGLSSCAGASNAVTWNNGAFGCNTITTAGSATTTLLADFNSWTNIQKFLGGFLSLASTTIGDGTTQGGLTVSGNATTTGNFAVVGTGTGRLFVGAGIQAASGGIQLNQSTGNIALAITGVNSSSIAQISVSSGTKRTLQIGNTSTGGFQTVFNAGNGTSTVGIGTSTPFAALSVHASSIAAPTMLFAIGSSTASATTTLFSVDNTGLASTTYLYGAGLATCNSGNVLTWSGGLFGCAADATGGVGSSFSYPFPSSATSSPLALDGGVSITSNELTLNSSTLILNTSVLELDAESGSNIIFRNTADDRTYAGISAQDFNKLLLSNENSLGALLDLSSITGSNKTFIFPNQSGTICIVGVLCDGFTFSSTSASFWITATTSLPSITTLANLGTVKTSLSGLISSNSGLLYNTATTTASCAGTLSCSSFTILGSSPVTLTGPAFPFTPTTWGGVTANSTSTVMQFLAGAVSASSTVGTLTVGTSIATSSAGIGTSTPGSKLAIQGTGSLFQVLYNAVTPIIHIVDNIVTLAGTWNFGGATVTGLPYYPAFTYATSTAWTATTTIPLGPAYNAQTWKGVKCFTDTGTLNIVFHDGSNKMNLFNASTTVGTVGLVTNNTFTASETRYVDVGTPASSPTKISCTISYQDS